MGSTNGPGVNGAGQYYSWSIGLGANYAYGSYQAQFALPRNVGNPYLCIRYRENGGWGGWNRISAGYADSAGTLSGNPTIGGYVGIGTNSPSTRLHVAYNAPYTQYNNSYYITYEI